MTLTSSCGEREFSLVVLGPTGFQGRRVLAELSSLLCVPGSQQHRLAVAGRDAGSIEDVLEALGGACRIEAIAGCDAGDAAVLRQLAARTQVLISCCGDFSGTAPVVLGACVAEGTHYLDASLGCPREDVQQLWRQLRRDHQQAAVSSGALVFNALGFDTVIADFGGLLTARRFEPPTVPYTIGSFLTLTAPRGQAMRKDTFLQHMQQRPARSTSFAALPRSSSSDAAAAAEGRDGVGVAGDEEPPASAYTAPPPAGMDAKLGYCKELQCWAVKGEVCEPPLVRHTQALLLEQQEQQAAYYYTAHLTVPSPAFAATLFTERAVAWLAGKAGGLPGSAGTLLGSPAAVQLFTRLGLVTESEARWEESEKAKSFRKAFVGRGYHSGEEAAAAASGETTAQVVHITTISGPSPGYTVTPASLALAALVLLEERHLIPCPGGFTTPGAALGGTSFWRRLVERCGLQVMEE